MDLTPEYLKSAIDTVWVIVSMCLIFWMCAGFAMIEAGFARAKHTVHVLAMNFGVVAVVALGFWLVGFGLMFGNGNAFMGLSGFLLSLKEDVTLFSALSWTGVSLGAKFLFQMVFADTAATIVSGTVAERMKFTAYMLFSVFMVTLIYPIAGHWVWGGGFLSQLAVPMQDFAGSTVVHSIGGWAALVGTIMVGPRLGRFVNGKVRSMPAHNLSIATLGALILWLGWFGFNAGSTMAADPTAIGHIASTTMLGGATGMATAMFASWIFKKHSDLGLLLNGTLAGLVAITAGCNAVSLAGAVAIGGIAGVLCAASGPMFEKLRIDDPVGALPVHLINGIWGTLAVGLFATKAGSVGSFDGLLYGGGFALLSSQALGVAAVGAYVVVASIIGWSVVKALVGLRVSPSVELDGMDGTEHGATAYIFDELDEEEGSFLPGDLTMARTVSPRREVTREPAYAE